MNGIIRSPPMIAPLRQPSSPPASTVAATTTTAPEPFKIITAPSTPVNAMTEPTLRSIPPLTMMSVMPSAAMATTTVCVTMILKLAGERKNSRTSALSENRPTTSSRPRNGPRALRTLRQFMPTFGRPLRVEKCQCSFREILVQRRIEQFVDDRQVHVLLCNERDTGVDALFDGFALKMLHRAHHALIAHADGILHDQRVHSARLQCLDGLCASVKANELHRAGPAKVLQGEVDSDRHRLARSE